MGIKRIVPFEKKTYKLLSMSEKVLVIGGAGFIGSHTVDALLKEGMDVVILDNLRDRIHRGEIPYYLNPKAQLIIGDIRDPAVLSSSLQDVSYIYDFAAYQDYMTDFSAFFSTNAVGTALLYELILEKEISVKKIIIASSQFVQGEGIYTDSNGNLFYPKSRLDKDLKKGFWDFFNDKDEKLDWQWTTEDYSQPTNAYSMSKFTQEMIGMNLSRQYDIPTVILRYSIVQGSRQSLYNTYSGACRIFCLHYYNDIPPVIYEDGMMCRDFVNINDVVNANIIVLNNDKANGQIFNIGGGKAYTVIEFAEEVAKCFNKTDIRPIIPGEYRLGDTRHACSDISKMKKFGWEPNQSVRDSILDYIEYLHRNEIPSGILSETIRKMRSSGVIKKVDFR
jgi:dTDP-L-rhamnose 4-epimerase|tara:strand:- start:127 stop:1302 length:1176 start_codon:yes stop_codon:yes gene_type:complete